LYHQDCIDTLM